MSTFTLAISFDHFQFALIHEPDIPGSYQYCSLQHRTLLVSPVTSTSGCCSPSLHSFWSYFSIDLHYHIGHLPTWGVHLSVSCLFAFSYCSWGSQCKNTEVVCHSLLWWATFCQTSPPLPGHFGWSDMAWLSFIELDRQGCGPCDQIG